MLTFIQRCIRWRFRRRYRARQIPRDLHRYGTVAREAEHPGTWTFIPFAKTDLLRLNKPYLEHTLVYFNNLRERTGSSTNTYLPKACVFFAWSRLQGVYGTGKGWMVGWIG
jgi:hypothetical protein